MQRVKKREVTWEGWEDGSSSRSCWEDLNKRRQRGWKLRVLTTLARLVHWLNSTRGKRGPALSAGLTLGWRTANTSRWLTSLFFNFRSNFPPRSPPLSNLSLPQAAILPPNSRTAVLQTRQEFSYCRFKGFVLKESCGETKWHVGVRNCFGAQARWRTFASYDVSGLYTSVKICVTLCQSERACPQQCGIRYYCIFPSPDYFIYDHRSSYTSLFQHYEFASKHNTEITALA